MTWLLLTRVTTQTERRMTVTRITARVTSTGSSVTEVRGLNAGNTYNDANTWEYQC